MSSLSRSSLSIRSNHLQSCGLALAAAVAAVLASQAQATVLTFDFGGNNNTTILQAYGDRVNFATTPTPPPVITDPVSGFKYGTLYGPTPNIEVDYGQPSRLGGATPTDANRTFGNLTNVLYRDKNLPGTAAGIMEINFFADPGFNVFLLGFDLSSTYNSLTGQGEDLKVKSIRIVDGAGNNLRAPYTYPADAETTILGGEAPYIARHFDFTANPLFANTVRIIIDLTQLQTVGGSKVDRVGIDNIAFAQVRPIPAPGAAALGGIALAGLGLRRRR